MISTQRACVDISTQWENLIYLNKPWTHGKRRHPEATPPNQASFVPKRCFPGCQFTFKMLDHQPYEPLIWKMLKPKVQVGDVFKRDETPLVVE